MPLGYCTRVGLIRRCGRHASDTEKGSGPVFKRVQEHPVRLRLVYLYAAYPVLACSPP